MPSDSSKRHVGHLFEEHLILGAQFNEEGEVHRYEREDELANTIRHLSSTYVCDISNVHVTMFSGIDAPLFASSAFAGKRLEVGECVFEAVLTGDGGVASTPLLARTGNNEYAVFDFTKRADILDAWLSFLSSVSQNGYEPYARMERVDVTHTHTVLALWGEHAQDILADYTAAHELPAPNCIVSCNLDAIPCIVAHLSFGAEPFYLVLVPPRASVALWRSFLSFLEVQPVGMGALRATMRDRLAWLSLLDTADTLRIGKTELEEAGLVRATDDYVGARGLQAQGR